MAHKFLRALLACILVFTAKVTYGGQAVVQGVMMRGPQHYSISVKTSKGIQTEVFPFKSITKKYKLLGLPFIRGIIAFGEALIIGYKSLMYSSVVAAEDDDEPLDWFGWTLFVFTIILSMAFGIILFKFLPLGAATLIDRWVALPSWLFNVVDGVIKMSIFVSYLYIIGIAKDIKDLFRYHGGEHKAINCYESGKKLTLKHILGSSSVHLRCGTTFIFIVFLLSIFVYILIPKTLPFWTNLALRLALLPVIAAISFELQQFSAKKEVPFLRALIKPGLWLQALTVYEPAPKHARTAKAALEAVIRVDEQTV